MILKNAFRTFTQQYPTGEIKGVYVDHRNKNYVNKVVGYRWMIKNVKGEERRFFVTFRPKGIRGYMHPEYGPMTGMNTSEIHFQFKYGWERLVLYLEIVERLVPYVYPNVWLKTWLAQNEPSFKNNFVSDEIPDEDERLYNFPITIAVSFAKWFKGEEAIP